MNKYSDKSDFEINKNVADKLGMEFPELSDKESYKPLAYFTECGNDILCFDPCNKPEDAMPIIIENKINLKHLANNTNNLVLANHKEYWCIRKNPYRAAMEVFLMLMDAE